MTVFLHIGMAKTASSTIQEFLAANRTALEGRGYRYPLVPGRAHMGLAIYAGSVDMTADLRKVRRLFGDEAALEAHNRTLVADLRAECDGAAHVILSCEQLSNRLRTADDIERLAELVRPLGDEVEVVCYLRRQDEFLLSRYSTQIRGGSEARLDLTDPPVDVFDHAYADRLDQWAEVFGRDHVVARPFQPADWPDADVLADFARSVRLGDVSGFQRPAEVVNASLDAEALEFLRRLNRHLPRFVDGAPNRDRDGVVQALERWSTGPKLRLAPDVAARYLAAYADQNRRVAREYLDPPRDHLFDLDFGSAEAVGPAELTLDRAMEMAAFVYANRPEVDLPPEFSPQPGLGARLGRRLRRSR